MKKLSSLLFVLVIVLSACSSEKTAEDYNYKDDYIVLYYKVNKIENKDAYAYTINNKDYSETKNIMGGEFEVRSGLKVGDIIEEVYEAKNFNDIKKRNIIRRNYYTN